MYLEDVKDLKVKFVEINGNFFLENFSKETIEMLIKGNPHDPEGFFDIMQIYYLIPRKEGSKAKKHTLIFRPSNWVLLNKNDNMCDNYDGLDKNYENARSLEDAIKQFAKNI